jgi:hypothetical protein
MSCDVVAAVLTVICTSHFALLLSKASGWRNHAFFHVHSA